MSKKKSLEKCEMSLRSVVQGGATWKVKGDRAVKEGWERSGRGRRSRREERNVSFFFRLPPKNLAPVFLTTPPKKETESLF